MAEYWKPATLKSSNAGKLLWACVYKAKCKTSAKPLSLITGFTDWLFFNWTSNIFNIRREVVEMVLLTENCNSSCQGKAWDFQANENKEVPLIILQSHRWISEGANQMPFIQNPHHTVLQGGTLSAVWPPTEKKFKNLSMGVAHCIPTHTLDYLMRTQLYILNQDSLMTSITQTTISGEHNQIPKTNGKAYGEKKETNLSHTVRYPRAMMIKLLHTPVARWAMLCPQGPHNLTKNPETQKESEKLEYIRSLQKHEKLICLQICLIFKLDLPNILAWRNADVKLQMDT